MFKHLVLATQAAFVLGALPVAQAAASEPASHAPAAASPAPTAPAQLDQLAFFEGTWTCTGTGFASPFGPEHATTATVVGSKAVGGMWMQVTYDENMSAANPHPVHAGVYMGYDAARKSFVSHCVDSFGAYCTQTASGWNGDRLSFEGTSMIDGKVTGARDSFVRKGAGEVVHSGELQGDDKQWIKTDEETCKKRK